MLHTCVLSLNISCWLLLEPGHWAGWTFHVTWCDCSSVGQHLPCEICLACQRLSESQYKMVTWWLLFCHLFQGCGKYGQWKNRTKPKLHWKSVVDSIVGFTQRWFAKRIALEQAVVCFHPDCCYSLNLLRKFWISPSLGVDSFPRFRWGDISLFQRFLYRAAEKKCQEYYGVLLQKSILCLQSLQNPRRWYLLMINIKFSLYDDKSYFWFK